MVLSTSAALIHFGLEGYRSVCLVASALPCAHASFHLIRAAESVAGPLPIFSLAFDGASSNPVTLIAYSYANAAILKSFCILGLRSASTATSYARFSRGIAAGCKLRGIYPVTLLIEMV